MPWAGSSGRQRARRHPALDQPLGFDADRGIITVEAGMRWPALLGHLAQIQDGLPVRTGSASVAHWPAMHMVADSRWAR